ncbi:EAL domain-containing protein [Rhizobium sp. XQZ8]|nr:EAL domain-containing protein [Rhizobium populisoli]
MRDMLARRSIRTSSGSILFFLSISGLATLGLVFLSAIWAGAESDAAALERQRGLVDARLQHQVQRVSQEITLIGAGYETLLSADPSAVIAEGVERQRSGTVTTEAFGKIATAVFAYNAAFLVRGNGELAANLAPDEVRRYRWVRPLLQPLLQDIDAMMSSATSQSTAAGDLSRVELMRLEGRPSVAGVVSISDTSARRAGSASSDRLYLVVFRFLDGALLDMISREQGLAGARYARTQDQENDEVAFQIEATKSGEPIGYIIWQPDLPGSRVVGRLVPVLSIAGVIIAVLFFALMARLRRSLRELSASEQNARHVAVHDVLTGIPNRLLFVTRFEKYVSSMGARSSRGVLALIDLDRFKQVNDTYGHPAGDELLHAAVARMRALIGDDDTLARIGGDEFALLLPDIDVGDHSQAILKDFIDELSKPFLLKAADAVVRIGCSIGVALFEGPNLGTTEMLRRADVALYQAKANGRGQVVAYDPSLDRLVSTRENLKNDLRIELERGAAVRSSEVDENSFSEHGLEVFYQGVHRSGDLHQLSGAEALIRWRHPVHGLLSPDKFIPLAEEAGLIDQVGEWVLENAAKAAARWPDDLTIAVNVSPLQIRRSEFDKQVLGILEKTGLSPSRLELEVTEATLFELDEKAHAGLTRLRSAGVRIALDDFGTGYSSLSHLIQFNIDRIKIDKSFVRLLGNQAEGAAIISAILGLSRTLGKMITAEGVETVGQRDFLISAGCHDLQGYLFSRPMPVDEFETMLWSSRLDQRASMQI